MEFKLYGNQSFRRYMLNYLFHPDCLNLTKIIKNTYIDEKEKSSNSCYKLSYENHTGEIRRYDGQVKVVVKTKIPQDLIRFLEKIAHEIKIDKEEESFSEEPKGKSYMAGMDPKYWMFFEKKHPKLKRELLAIIILLQNQRDFPIIYEELLVQSARPGLSFFPEKSVVFKLTQPLKMFILKFLN